MNNNLPNHNLGAIQINDPVLSQSVTMNDREVKLYANRMTITNPYEEFTFDEYIDGADLVDYLDPYHLGISNFSRFLTDKYFIILEKTFGAIYRLIIIDRNDIPQMYHPLEDLIAADNFIPFKDDTYIGNIPVLLYEKVWERFVQKLRDVIMKYDVNANSNINTISNSNSNMNTFNNSNSNVNANNQYIPSINTNYPNNRQRTNRNLPANAENSISMNAIENGTNMVNFHDEFGHGRYYKASTFNSIRRNNDTRLKHNPSTRQPIAPTNITRYRARVPPKTKNTNANTNVNSNGNGKTRRRKRKTRKSRR